MIKDFIANLGILIASLFLMTNLAKHSLTSNWNRGRIQLLVGALSGIIANILMYYSVPVQHVIVDMRNTPLILSAYYGGPLATAICVALIIIGRLFYGWSMAAGVGILLTIITGVFAIYISRLKLSKYFKTVIIITLNNILFTLSMLYLLKEGKELLKLLPIYYILSYISGCVGMYVVGYIRKNQLLFSQYKVESSIDGLTGLNNVRTFDNLFNRLMEHSHLKKEPIGLLYIDIDFFKNVNDTYGHTNGDIVLKGLSEVIRDCIRKNDILSRNGGEEFTVLLPNCPLAQATAIGEAIRMSVEKHPFILSDTQPLHITVSIGLAVYPDTTTNPDHLIDAADKALYSAKQNGRNQVWKAGDEKSYVKIEKVKH